MITCAGLVTLLVDASLKAVLLAVLAGTTMWLARLRSTAVQHRIWIVVLIGMLLMPLLVAVTPAVPLPRWAYPDLHVEASTKIHPATPATQVLPAIVTKNLPSNPSAASSEIEKLDSPPAAPHSPDSAGGPSAARTARINIWLYVVVAYALGFAVFGSRVLIGLIAARHLLRTATVAQLPPSEKPELDTITVLESRHVRVPLTVGWMRPAIMLPSDWPTWDVSMLGSVLTHELAHVRRKDTLVALAAQINLAIYWFHPLAWFLVRRLTTLAEAACDDAVIASLDNRTDYARHLLTVAARLAGQAHRFTPQRGVAMAARPVVEHRIDSILDFRRPLARRVGWFATVLLLIALIPTTILTASLSAEKGSNELSQLLPELQVTPASEGGIFTLTVLDNNDHPIANANVTVRVRQEYMGSDTWKHEQTDNAGRLRVQLPKPLPHFFSIDTVKPGYAPFLAAWEQRDGPDPIPAEYTLRLDPGRTIGGIVQDDKGQPIEGVAVSPFFNVTLRAERTRQMGAGAKAKTDSAGRWTYASLPTDLDSLEITFKHPDYIEQRVSEAVTNASLSREGNPKLKTVLTHGLILTGHVKDADGKPVADATIRYFHLPNFSSDAPATTTDASGQFRFECGEVGEALITASSSEHAPAMRTVEITKNTATIEFQLPAGSPMRVRVVDPDKKPLGGAYIALWNWDEQNVFGSLVGSRGKTDKNGEWHWDHAPTGALEFSVSHEGYSYVSGISLTPGNDNLVEMSALQAVPLQGKLFKIFGRVTDADSKEVIPRFRVTAGYQSEKGGRTIWLQETQAKERDGHYLKSFGSNDLAKDTFAVVLRVEADGYKPSIVTHIISNTNDARADVTLERSSAADSYRVVTPQGQPAAGATVAVCTPEAGPIIQEGTVDPNSTCERTTADANGGFSVAPQRGPYRLLVVHDSGAAYPTQVQITNSRTITLEPWARVEGTLKMHGQLASDETIRIDRHEANMNSPRLFCQDQTKTDKNGRFAFERVLPGQGHVSRVSVSQEARGMTRLTPTVTSDVTFKPGETLHVDLGRDGRNITGRLMMPADVKPGNDWRHAMLTLQSRPHGVPSLPQPPFPPGVDPKKDREAAIKWWNEWRLTDAGKAFDSKMKKYVEAMKGFQPVNYSGHCEPDGSFTFDDIPPGDYQINVQAYTAKTVPGGFQLQGEPIATLEHLFAVPELSTPQARQPLDLGTMTLKPLQSP